MGEKLTSHDSRIPLLNWIKNKFWFPEYITSIDMQYGIKQEPKAILAYTKVKDVPVIISGLWINKMYPHLGASPDGLIMDLENTTKLCGIIEVNCLKILKNRTVTDLITSQHSPRNSLRQSAIAEAFAEVKSVSLYSLRQHNCRSENLILTKHFSQ